MSKTEYTFRVGDAVWAKMKGFSAWPGKIEIPTDGMKRPAMKKVMHCVFFFGSHNYAWIMETDLKPYMEFKETLNRDKKSGNFKKAIDEIEDYLAGKGNFKTSAATQAAAAAAAASGSKNDPEKDAEFDALLSAKKSQPNSAKSGKAVKRPKKSLPDDDSTPVAKKQKSKVKKPTLENSDDTAASHTPVTNHTPSAKKTAIASFLDRPTAERPASPSFDIGISANLQEKDIQPSNLNFGFLGLGIMGRGMVRNLINSGHKVTIWNRSPEKCVEFNKIGAKEVSCPGDVIAESDITFSCVSDPHAAKEMVFGNCGVLGEITAVKGYVEMTGIDADTSQDIAEAIKLKSGRYLEAQVQGSKDEARDGTLVVLAAGDRDLFDDCRSCFQAMGKHSFYLGDVGNASKMNLVLQLMAGVTLAGLAEGMALADRAGLKQKDILDVLKLTSLACPLMQEKGQAIIEGGFPTNHPLQHMQKDLKLSLNMADQLEQPLPLTASANEVFKHAKRLGYGEHDTSAVYIRARF